MLEDIRRHSGRILGSGEKRKQCAETSWEEEEKNRERNSLFLHARNNKIKSFHGRVCARVCACMWKRFAETNLGRNGKFHAWNFCTSVGSTRYHSASIRRDWTNVRNIGEFETCNLTCGGQRGCAVHISLSGELVRTCQGVWDSELGEIRVQPNISNCN